MITLMTEMIISFLLLIILFANNDSEAIDCFRCNSFGGANSYCEDPFHNNFSATILQSPCWTGRKGRDGLYPATACIKLSGRFEDNGDTMIVRDCALDSGSLTTDTELVRMSHCGGFYFDNRYVKGCVQVGY
ncbi:carbonic anhydrase 2-like [Sarcoptes scabiei]|nr:carbonic anhydrase 2-like [Sarcoptes scabiei]